MSKINEIKMYTRVPDNNKINKNNAIKMLNLIDYFNDVLLRV